MCRDVRLYTVCNVTIVDSLIFENRVNKKKAEVPQKSNEY